MADIPYKDGDQVFIQMMLKDPNAGTSQDMEVMGNHIMNFEFTQLQGTAAEFNLTLYDATFDSLERVLFSKGFLEPSRKKQTSSLPVIGVKWGWTNSDRNILSPEWDMRLVDYKSKFTIGSGTQLTLTGTASPGLLHTRGGRIANAENHAQTLGELVAEIAKDNNMDFDVEDAAFIERIGPLHQRGQNDITWLKKIVKYAIKPHGKNRKYEVWVRNRRASGKQELIVRTDKHQQSVGKTWNYLYGLDRDGQILEYETSINSNILHAIGGGGFRTVVMDSRSKEFKHLITDESTLGGTAGEGKYIPQGSNTRAPLRVGFQNEEAAKAFAAHQYLMLNNTNITSSMVVHGNPLIDPSDLVNVVIPRKARQPEDIRDVHPSSGHYKINSVVHNISNGQYTTELSLYRRGNSEKGAGGSKETTGTVAANNAVANTADIFNKTGGRAAELAKKQKQSDQALARDKRVHGPTLSKYGLQLGD